MPGTRGKVTSKEKNSRSDSSLVDKVRQLSPGSHASLSRSGVHASSGRTEVSALRSQTTDPQDESDNHNSSGQVDLTQIHQLILEVRNSLNSHKQTVSQQIQKLNDSFEAHIDNQMSILSRGIKQQIQDSINDIQKYVDMEVGRLSSQIEDITARVSTLEKAQTPEYDPEVSVIMSMVPQHEGEDIQQTAEDIIHTGLNLPDVPVVRAMRLRQREVREGQRRPGPPLVKVQLPNLEVKKQVLRSKTRLGNTTQWARVWIRSSKPHVERLIDLNFRKLLEIIPGGNTMTITNSGRIVKKND